MPARKKKPAKNSTGLDAAELAAGEPPREVRTLAIDVVADGGAVLATYRDPLEGRWLLLVGLPMDKVSPTPYQRELSPAHVKRLIGVIPKVGRFLDPVIAIRHENAYWTPNGMHRLEAMRALGARSIVALLLPEPEVAYRILALNTEKAHNLRDKSLEAVRMARALAAAPETAKKPAEDFALELEEAAYLVIGPCYEENGRFAGGAYLPVVKRCVELGKTPLGKSLAEHAARATRLLELDAAVNECVERLREAGLKSPYLKTFVVARINPLRFVRAAKPGQKAPRADFDATVDKMLAGCKKLDASKVRPQDLTAMAGAAAAAEE